MVRWGFRNIENELRVVYDIKYGLYMPFQTLGVFCLLDYLGILDTSFEIANKIKLAIHEGLYNFVSIIK